MKKEGLDFNNCNMTNVYIKGANLENTVFRKTLLKGATLYDCNLQGASFEGADLSEADLGNSDLHYANLKNARMQDDVNLEGAKGIYQFGPIGEFDRICYAVDWGDKIMFQIGCFWGTEEEAVEKVSEKYGGYSSYVQQVKLAAQVLKEKRTLK